MKIKEILDEIEKLAPLQLQESFDNAGVQVGNVGWEATGAVLCLDVTEDVVDEAVEMGYNLIISHHPLAFKPFKSLTGRNYIERCIIKACKHELVIYAAHTNLDNAFGGLNFHLAELIGLKDVRILSPQKNMLLKLAVFVPDAYAEAVRQAIFGAGAGHIGNYDLCSFNQKGEGSFRAGEKASPFCGQAGILHTEKETKIEVALPSFRKSAVISAMLKAHPYEEPAFDLYQLANAWEQSGSGIIGTLPEEMAADSFLKMIKEKFKLDCLKHSAFAGTIKKVAVCGGSGAFLIPEAIAAGADVFITGEAKYNDYYDVEGRILLAVVGHYESESFTKDIFHNIISKKFPTFALHFSNVNSNPVKYL